MSEDTIIERIGNAVDGWFDSVDVTTGTIYIDEGGETFAVSVMKCDKEG